MNFRMVVLALALCSVIVAAEPAATGSISIRQGGAIVDVRSGSATVAARPLEIEIAGFSEDVFAAWMDPRDFPELRNGAVIGKMIGTGAATDHLSVPINIPHIASRDDSTYPMDSADLGFSANDVQAMKTQAIRLGASSTVAAYVFSYAAIPTGKSIAIAWPDDVPATSPIALVLFSSIEKSKHIRWERVHRVVFVRQAP